MKEIIAYASGVNEAREVAGFALAGVPIGASVSNLREDAIEAILRAAGPVFLDSGAFSEVRFSPKSQRVEIMNRIAPREWRRRLDIYLRAARHWETASVSSPQIVLAIKLRRSSAWHSTDRSCSSSRYWEPRFSFPSRSALSATRNSMRNPRPLPAFPWFPPSL